MGVGIGVVACEADRGRVEQQRSRAHGDDVRHAGLDEGGRGSLVRMGRMVRMVRMVRRVSLT